MIVVFVLKYRYEHQALSNFEINAMKYLKSSTFGTLA